MDHDPTVRPGPGTAEGDAALLSAIGAGDESAFGQLYDAWFDRCYDVALRIVRDDDAAADVAQDAFLAAWRNIDDLEDRQAFGGWLLRITRNRALDHKRKHDRTSPVDAETMAVIEAAGGGSGAAGVDPEARLAAATDPARAVEDAEIVELVWQAAAALGDRDASLLDLHLRHGLAPVEIAEELGVQPNAAHQSLHRLRDRLGAAVAARVLWRGGTPACPELAGVLQTGGGAAFDGDTAARIRRHAKTCDECTGRQRSQLEPSKLFAAIPVAIAPLALKAKAAAAMEAAGVPMSGSAQQATSGAGTAASAARGRRRLSFALAAVVVLIAALTAVLAFTIESIDHDPRGSVSTTVGTDDSTSTTGPDPSTTAGGPLGNTPDTVTPDNPSPGPAGRGPGAIDPAVPPAPGPATPTTPSILTFRLDPTSVPTESAPPMVAWRVDPAGSGTAELTGPNLYTTALSGTQSVCPGIVDGGVCVTAPGAYDYTLHAYDEAGDLIDVRTITLVVG
jgi:RNA polymerase sigma factor (sigma-70 family)